jgi:Outer membrane lipoprotein carrier protein LolA
MRFAKRVALTAGLLTMAATPAASVFDHPQSAAQLLADVLSQPTQFMREADVVRGKFLFDKYLAGVKRPLRSSGDFVYARKQGLLWHTRKPFDSELIMTGIRLVQRDDGKIVTMLNASSQPAVRVFADLLQALLALNVTQLQKTFELYGQKDAVRWELGLRTRGKSMSVFSDATLGGRTLLETIELRESNGDRTEVSFQELTLGHELSASEKSSFRVRR